MRLGFDSEEKRQVRARQRRGALFFRAAAGGFRLNERLERERLALAAVAAFRRKPELARERQLPLRVGERALELRRARGRRRPVRFAQPQGFRRAARPGAQLAPERRQERQNLGELPARAQLGESRRGFQSVSRRDRDETEPIEFFVRSRTVFVFSRRLASSVSERKRVVRVVLLRGDRGEVVHERHRSCFF